MADKGRYCVVKFLPDRIRFEPVNIGLIAEFEDQVVTIMSSDLDPRIRYADPHADTRSLLATLVSFDANAYSTASKSGLDRLADGDVVLPNVYVDRPLGMMVTDRSFQLVVDALFARLVTRSFVQPGGYQRQIGPSMARTVLRNVFHQANALGPLVQSSVDAVGKSGVVWQLDFRYLSDELHLIQTATTGLREDLRRSEHAFRAFAALIDTTQLPGVRGILAADEPAESNYTSDQLRRMAEAHGFDFYGGRRGFLSLAKRVTREAKPVSDDSGPAQPTLIVQ